MLDTEKLEPMPHPHKKGYWRVPVCWGNHVLTIYAGYKFVRILDEAVAPPTIRSKLAIASATSTSYVEDPKLYMLDMYCCPVATPHLSDIGWRASTSYYVVVLPTRSVNKLKGS